jgi:two-component system, chemotaxis family, response regulator Rcp1
MDAHGPLDILLVEDNPGDVRLTQEALKQWNRPTRLRVASDGVEALDMLNGNANGTGLPDIILLDLNLPRLSGREVLREIKASALLRRIPVIVLSTSESDDDVLAAYALHANCYVVKPASLDSYLEALLGIEAFWARLARIPPGDWE